MLSIVLNVDLSKLSSLQVVANSFVGFAFVHIVAIRNGKFTYCCNECGSLSMHLMFLAGARVQQQSMVTVREGMGSTRRSSRDD